MMSPSDEQLSFGDFDPEEGERRKREGQERARRAQRVQVWKKRADEWFYALAWGMVFTADTLIAAVGVPDIGANRNNVVGAWFSGKARKGEIEWTGHFAKSGRATRHASYQRIWRKVV